MQSISIQLFDTNRLALRETLHIQCICRAKLLIDTTHLPCCLPCNYVTSPLAYSRQQKRINRYTYCIKLFLSIFNSTTKKLSNLESSFLIIDTSWKNKNLIISTQTFRIVTNLSKTFLQTQSFCHCLKSKTNAFRLSKNRIQWKEVA